MSYEKVATIVSNYPHKGFKTFVQAEQERAQQAQQMSDYFKFNVIPRTVLDLAKFRYETFYQMKNKHTFLVELHSLKPDQTEVWPEHYSQLVQDQALRTVQIWEDSTIHGDVMFEILPSQVEPVDAHKARERPPREIHLKCDWHDYWYGTETQEDVTDFYVRWLERHHALRCAIFLYKKNQWKRISQETLPVLEDMRIEESRKRRRDSDDDEAAAQLATNGEEEMHFEPDWHDFTDSESMSDEDAWSLDSSEEDLEIDETTPPPAKRYRLRSAGPVEAQALIRAY